jgi:uncharacterized membrane protein
MGPSWSLGDLEDLVSQRGLAWLGGLALLLGAVFFLSLAFSRGWIGPAARVTIGLVAGTALVLLGAWFFDRRERLFGHVLVAVGIGVLSMSLLAAARLYQLIRVEAGLAGTLLLWSGATAALGALIVVLVAGYRQYHRTHRQARWLAVLAASLTVYLLSVGVVDEFQRRVDGPTPLEELQKQAQVALSILWGVLGVVAFVLGIARRRVATRAFGLALLALTTAKVYLYDLASLDAAYRVLSFVGLGILLLISSDLYQRFAPRLTDDRGAAQGH